MRCGLLPDREWLAPLLRPGESSLRYFLEPLRPYLDDKDATDIVINKPGEIGIERPGNWTWEASPALTFERLDAIASLCAALSQQEVGPERPLCGGTLPDGQRVQICRPPAVASGLISLTIRRPSGFRPTVSLLAEGGLFAHTANVARPPSPHDAELRALHQSKDWQRFFPLAVKSRKTIIVSGDTGSGKTTFAKALIQEIPHDERLITIEDTAEFQDLPQRNLVSLFYSKGDQGIAKISSEALIEAALRMRPDRVLMQELRDGAAFSFIRNIAAGHPGSITTCHADSASGAFTALRLMVKQHDAGKHLADHDVATLLHGLVDVIVHCRKDRASGRFGIEEVFFTGSVPRTANEAPALRTLAE